MSRQININCPKECGDEFTFTMERQWAEDGEWAVAEEVKQNCDCRLSDAEMEQLEKEAAQRYFEPDED